MTWWNSIKAALQRMGKIYADRANEVNFWPNVVVWGGGDNSGVNHAAYLGGLNQAQSFLEVLVEELKEWGFEGGESASKSNHASAAHKEAVVFNLTISQQQVQQITQTINIAQYDEDVQNCVYQLLDELKKKDKDKTKIIGLVKWLADKGADALIAILLASTHLT